MVDKDFLKSLMEDVTNRPEIKEDAFICLLNAINQISEDYITNTISTGERFYALTIIEEIARTSKDITDNDFTFLKTIILRVKGL